MFTHKSMGPSASSRTVLVSTMRLEVLEAAEVEGEVGWAVVGLGIDNQQ